MDAKTHMNRLGFNSIVMQCWMLGSTKAKISIL